MKELQHINTTVIYSNECYENINMDESIKKKLSVDDKLYKHRFYYKTVWDTNKPILTFIMFNPSTANQYSTDPTINNCIKLAKKGIGDTKFGGIEIYNLITIRHPSVIRTMEFFKKEEKRINPLFNDDFKDKHICLAWGGKINKGKNDLINAPHTLKSFNDKKKYLIDSILEKLKTHPNLYIYGNGKNTENYTKPRHPSPIAFNTIKNQRLIKISYEKIDKNL